MMNRFEMHSNLMRSACFWFSFKESDTFIICTLNNSEICQGLPFLPSCSPLGRPLAKITSTSTNWQIYSTLIIFHVTVYKKMINLFNFSVLKLRFQMFVPLLSLSEY